MAEKLIKRLIKELEAKAKSKGLTMYKVCIMADMQPSMWWHWKKGRYSPRLLSFQKLHDVVDEYKS